MKCSVLHVVPGIGGGVGKLIAQWYYNIDPDKVSQCVLTWMKGEIGEQLEHDGMNVIEIPRIRKTGLIGYTKRIYTAMKACNCNVVHSHVGVFSPCVFIAAMLAGVRVRIIHSHATKFDYDREGKIRKIGLHLLFHICVWMATDYTACSEEAGQYFFGDKVVAGGKFHVINNGIDVKKYIYNPEIRRQLRTQYGVEGKYVIINVGRLTAIKNQGLILRIVENMRKKGINVALWLIGAGEDEGKLRRETHDLRLENIVTFWGWRSEVPELLQAADAFLMPSIAEGFGIAVIEAETADLPCVISNTIPASVCITSKVERIALEAAIDVWAKAVLAYQDSKRVDTSEKIIERGYDIQSSCMVLEEMYCDLIQKVIE